MVDTVAVTAVVVTPTAVVSPVVLVSSVTPTEVVSPVVLLLSPANSFSVSLHQLSLF